MSEQAAIAGEGDSFGSRERWPGVAPEMGESGSMAPPDILWRSQAQPPPTIGVSWQGRYTDKPRGVTSGALVIFVSRGMEVQGV
ncbi:MAG: hypothetical protein EOP26_11485 [Rhodococcus sp. (in: high G+C Gram-positive bacteria)]|nr:MAG: hypothetical protein EOP26_11485 [Rhodococcus sp. (in: high G+C Gram-positive bacteria)]